MKLIDPFVVTLLKTEWQLPSDTSQDRFREEYPDYNINIQNNWLSRIEGI